MNHTKISFKRNIGTQISNSYLVWSKFCKNISYSAFAQKAHLLLVLTFLSISFQPVSAQSNPFKDLLRQAPENIIKGLIEKELRKKRSRYREREGQATGQRDFIDQRQIQSALAKRGYDPGPIDGQPGSKTRTAIQAFQKKNGFRVTGYLTEEEFAVLTSPTGQSSPSNQSPVNVVKSDDRAPSVWMHNGSKMTLIETGARRSFQYVKPARDVLQACARSGYDLFKGRRVGEQYIGVGYLFSCQCGEQSYRVAGRIEKDGKRVVLSGRAPVRNGSCRTIGYKTETLVFDFLSPSQSNSDAPRVANQAPTNGGNTLALKPVQPTPTNNKDATAAPSGIWKGHYTCRQGLTGATLSFNGMNGKSGTAKFEFYQAKGGPRVPYGSMEYAVRFDPKNKNLRLIPKRWIVGPPPTFRMIAISGRFNDSMTHFDGKVLNSACGTIVLTKVPANKPQSPRVATSNNSRDTPRVASLSADKRRRHTADRQSERRNRDRRKQITRRKRSVTSRLSQVRLAGRGYVKLGFAKSGYCSREMIFQVTSSRIDIYANDRAELRALVPKILEHARRDCPDLELINLKGRVTRRKWSDTLLYTGELGFKTDWQLRDLVTPLQKAMSEVIKLTGSFEKLSAFHRHISKYKKIFGGDNSPDTLTLRRKLDERIDHLAWLYLSYYEGKLAKEPISIATLDGLTKRPHKMLKKIEKNAPNRLSIYHAAIEKRTKEVRDALEGQFSAKVDKLSTDWRQAAKTVTECRKILSLMDDRLPMAKAKTVAKISKIEKIVTAAYQGFASGLADYNNDWKGHAELLRERTKLSAQTGQIKAFSKFVQTADVRLAEILGQILKAATSKISDFGSTIQDIESLLDHGTAMAKKFSDAKHQEMADTINLAIANRITSLVESNFTTFKTTLSELESTTASIEKLHDAIQEYGGLASAIPAFAKYQGFAQQRLKTIEIAICESAVQKSGASRSVANKAITVAGLTTTLGNFICRTKRTNNPVTKISTSWLSWTIIANITTIEGVKVVIALKPQTSKDGKASVLTGVSRKDGSGPETALTEKEWDTFSAEIVRPRPTGKPDRNGITECDRLASHPKDPAKLAAGLTDEKIDAERALEACVAAVERRPTEARQIYHLGRILQLVGEQKKAMTYLQAAADGNYAAAHVELGDIYFGDQKTASKALAHYKLALKHGYKSASELVEMLSVSNEAEAEMPAPTPSEVLSSIRTNKCTTFLGVRTCVRIVDVTLKNCFQVSATDFSCEFRPQIRCKTSASAVHSRFLQMACNKTEFNFGTFRKISAGQWKKID